MSMFSAVAASGGFDIAPNALNWANITELEGSEEANADVNVTGKLSSRTIRATCSGNPAAGSPQLKMFVAGSLVDTETIATNAFVEASVSNGQNVHFSGNPAGGLAAITVTVTNVTDGNRVLDTFTMTLQ